MRFLREARKGAGVEMRKVISVGGNLPLDMARQKSKACTASARMKAGDDGRALSLGAAYAA